MDADKDVTDAAPDVPGESLLPEPPVNRYSVPLTTLVGGAVVAHGDQVVIQPVPSTWVPGDGAATSGADGD